jgi:cysteine desulfurase/selenocysteine lyase
MEKTISSRSQDSIMYFDNAATSFPKPEGVAQKVFNYIEHIGGNPGRSGHGRSIESGEIVFYAREKIAALFGLQNPMHVIFTLNATDALNLAIRGLLKKGDHVITTSMEHNSTIRPLKALENDNIIELSIVQCSSRGHVSVSDLKGAVKSNTRAMVINHGSNITGTLQPIGEIGALCKEKGVSLIADCAQSGGIIDIDMSLMNIDLLAFAGHKGLYGPTGTGGLVISEDFDFQNLHPLRWGGTGSFSDRITQPLFLPDKYESGTMNTAGIAGLLAGLEYIESLPCKTKSIRDHKKELVNYFFDKSAVIKGFQPLNGPEDIETGVISFNIDGMDSSEVAMILEDDKNIMCRAGLHCAPLAHQTMGSFPHGTVRFSFGLFNTKEEIDVAIEALKSIGEGI